MATGSEAISCLAPVSLGTVPVRSPQDRLLPADAPSPYMRTNFVAEREVAAEVGVSGLFCSREIVVVGERADNGKFNTAGGTHIVVQWHDFLSRRKEPLGASFLCFGLLTESGLEESQ